MLDKKIENLIKYSLEKYVEYFDKNISKVLKENPEDSNDENGKLFWGSSRIMPHPITFNIEDEMSKNFIFYFCKIINRILKLNININYSLIINKCKEIYNNILNESNNAEFFEKEFKEKLKKEEKEELGEKLKEELKSKVFKLGNFKTYFISEQFEKDNDNNFHVDFLTCFSNLRARNYNIEECNREKVRKIAGNIIPAIASTTVAIAGFVSIQIYSVLLSDDINNFRNIGLDLATNWYSLGKPEKMNIYENKKIKGKLNLISIPLNHSIWDNIFIEGPLSKQIINFFKNKYNINIKNENIIVIMNAY